MGEISYLAEGPRIDIIRFMHLAVLNQNRYLFTFTPEPTPLGHYRPKRKNCCGAPEMGLVTTFCPLMMTGDRGTGLQTGSRFVVDCKVKLRRLVGQTITTLLPEKVMPSCGVGNERLNTVPSPLVPPSCVVPYNVLPDKIKLACGEAPSLFVPETTR